MYHPNSDYGKLEKLLSGNECICGSSKIPFKPFCFGCVDELKDKDFPMSKLYQSGEKGLDNILEGIEELGFRLG